MTPRKVKDRREGLLYSFGGLSSKISLECLETEEERREN